MKTDDRYARQSFLGAGSQTIFEKCRVAIIGLGGGGSHIVQQLAHIGFKNYVLYDGDRVEETNLNRLVGATSRDVSEKTYKIDVARRLIQSLHADAVVERYYKPWQEESLPLRNTDIIFGCVDGFAQRRELETFARRFLVPLIDIGIGVNTVEGEPPQLAGQVILSLPDMPCMQCLGFLTQNQLAAEAQKYGDAGDRPQVVWANGVVASTAVGMAVDLLTNWTNLKRQVVYLSYYGNKGTIEMHNRLIYADLKAGCEHFRSTSVGEPRFTRL